MCVIIIIIIIIVVVIAFHRYAYDGASVRENVVMSATQKNVKSHGFLDFEKTLKKRT